MKKLNFLFVATALVCPVLAFAASFEGKVAMKMTAAKGTPQPMVFSLKDGMSRVDVTTEGNTMGVIMDQAKQEMIMLMPQQKMYMVQPIPKPETMAATGKGSSTATVEKTNVTEKILGYTCVKYLAKDKDTTTEIWITDQLGTFMGINQGGGAGGMGGGRGKAAAKDAAAQAWENEFRGKNAFPLRVVSLTSGKESFRMEATAIDKQSLPDSIFQPPADYQKFEMGGMLKGLLPGGFKIPGTR